jgi:AcrR family transcriptional regulator
MKDDTKSERRRQIIEAAYAVLAEKGYAGTSMLAVAKRARASNETLYSWFGSKPGLFQAMVEENARAAAEILQEHPGGDGDPDTALSRIGPALLRLVTSERAIALNRAAAAESTDTGTLGRTIAASGREHIVPLLERLFAGAAAAGRLAGRTPVEAAELYISLLIGDLQIRRVIGVAPAPDEDEIARRAERARQIVLPPAAGSEVTARPG